MHLIYLQGLLNPILLDFTPGVSDSALLGWDKEPVFLTGFQVMLETAATGPGPIL